MARKTVEEAKRTELYQTIKDILKEEYLALNLKKVTIEEEVGKNTSKISCKFSENGGRAVTLRSEGCGVLDAIFNGLLTHYSVGYPSLVNITFEAFDATPDFRKKKSSGSDAEIVVEIQFTNSSNTIMTFRNSGRSFVSAAVQGVFSAMEFYINSEKAFRKLKFLIQDAKQRGRADIRARYVSQISTIVKVTSYEDV